MNDETIRKQLLKAQRNEINEHYTYKWLAEHAANAANRQVLEKISKEELRHYGLLKRLTGTDVKPRKPRIWKYKFISRVLGLSFGLMLMEKGERVSQVVYGKLKEEVPELADMFLDEQRHESDVLGLLKDERIEYAGSIVLGLNDALVELTGALAGFTFALQNSRLIAATGFITGVAASMSMAVSEYLSAKEEAEGGEPRAKRPLKSATYTGITYIIAVLILIAPYFIFDSVYVSGAVMLVLSVLIIFAYSFYITTAKGLHLWRRFGSMAGISLGVAAISFLVGVAVREFFGVNI